MNFDIVFECTFLVFVHKAESSSLEMALRVSRILLLVIVAHNQTFHHFYKVSSLRTESRIMNEISLESQFV